MEPGQGPHLIVLRDIRLRLPAALLLGALGLLTAQRLITWAVLHERFAGTTAREYLAALVVGLRFDVNIACSLALPLLLLLAIAPVRSLAWRPMRSLVLGLAVLLGTACLAMVLIDFFFFEEYSERLNHKALDYLADGATWSMLWQDFPLARAGVAMALGLAGLAWAFGRVVFPAGQHASGLWRGVLQGLLVLPLLALGIRGTVGQKAMNTSLAYGGHTALLAQWSLNGGFTLREALFSRLALAQPLEHLITPLPDDEAFELTAGMLMGPGDTPVGSPQNPLLRSSDSGRPRRDHNVVLVLMESLSWHYIESMGGVPGLTPVIDGLIDDSLLMERCFSVGLRTNRGMIGTLSGFPDLPGTSIISRIETENTFLTLAEILRRRGYRTLFVHGGEAQFDHMLSFTRSNGFERTVFEDQFENPVFGNAYGWCDEDLYAQTLAEIDALDGDAPFFATLLTLSFHRPYQVPDGRVAPPATNSQADREQQCIRYTDWALGEFLEQARQRPWFDDTLFVFVADHAGGYLENPLTPATYRVPFVMYGPSLPTLDGLAGRRLDTVCSQTDVAPTILASLGGRYEHSFFGSSVLDRPHGRGFALLQRGDYLGLVGPDSDVVEMFPGQPPRLVHFSLPGTVRQHLDDTAGLGHDLQRRATALLQTAARLFEWRSYRLGPESSED